MFRAPTSGRATVDRREVESCQGAPARHRVPPGRPPATAGSTLLLIPKASFQARDLLGRHVLSEEQHEPATHSGRTSHRGRAGSTPPGSPICPTSDRGRGAIEDFRSERNVDDVQRTPRGLAVGPIDFREGFVCPRPDPLELLKPPLRFDRSFVAAAEPTVARERKEPPHRGDPLPRVGKGVHRTGRRRWFQKRFHTVLHDRPGLRPSPHRIEELARIEIVQRRELAETGKDPISGPIISSGLAARLRQNGVAVGRVEFCPELDATVGRNSEPEVIQISASDK